MRVNSFLRTLAVGLSGLLASGASPGAEPARTVPTATAGLASKENWQDGGSFSTPDEASKAGLELLKAMVAKRFKVVRNVFDGTWTLLFEPKN